VKKIKKTVCNFLFTEDERKKLKIMAYSKGETMTSVLRRLIEKAWAERGK